MPQERDIIAEAIARGDASAAHLVANRDKMIEAMVALALVTGIDHLDACVAGGLIAVKNAHAKHLRSVGGGS